MDNSFFSALRRATPVTEQAIPRKVPAGAGKMPEACIIPESVRQAILTALCHDAVYGARARSVLGGRREGEVAEARFMFVFVLRACWGESTWLGWEPMPWAIWQQIGRAVNREYTTAIHGFSRADAAIRTNPAYRARVLRLLGLLARSLGGTYHYERIECVRRKIADYE
jgi:hypothetical protein